jgi:primosomal protein N' (replication factor Y)
MMTQVSGRAGRSEKKGKVIIQTFNPNHNTIQQVTNNDYLQCIKSNCTNEKFINIHHSLQINKTDFKT